MIRRLFGILVLLMGMAVLSIGFYAPLHAQIYRTYLGSVDSLRDFSQGSLRENPQDLTQQIATLLSSWFSWNSEEIAKYLPVTVNGCSSAMGCYARCEELLDIAPLPGDGAMINAHAAYNSFLAQLALPGKGTIISSGSSTLFPLTEHMAQCYAYRTAARQPIDPDALRIQIASVGTRGNLDHFCDGGEDLHNASDLITAAQFGEHGCSDAVLDDLVQFTVARDALVIVINKANPLSTVALNDRQLRFLLAYAEQWSEVDPLGASATIIRYYPSLDSGTRSILTARLFADSGISGAALLDEARFVRPHENDRWAARQIARNPAATGFFGYRFFRDEQANLHALAIEGITPDDLDHYPLTRPLYLYTTKTKLATNPLLRDFLRYYLGSVDKYAKNLGYFPLSNEENGAELARLEMILKESSN